MINTRNRKITPMLNDNKKYIYALETYETAFDEETYFRIKEEWNDGEKLEDVALNVKRHPAEVIVALMDMALKGHKIRPLHKVF